MGGKKRERERSLEERKRRAEPCFREAPTRSPRRPWELRAVHSQAERGCLELYSVTAEIAWRFVCASMPVGLGVCVDLPHTALACLVVKGRYPSPDHPAQTLRKRAAWRARRVSERTAPRHPQTFPVSGNSLLRDTIKELLGAPGLSLPNL